MDWQLAQFISFDVLGKIFIRVYGHILDYVSYVEVIGRRGGGHMSAGIFVDLCCQQKTMLSTLFLAQNIKNVKHFGTYLKLQVLGLNSSALLFYRKIWRFGWE